jgi:hypothetical protein
MHEQKEQEVRTRKATARRQERTKSGFPDKMSGFTDKISGFTDKMSGFTDKKSSSKTPETHHVWHAYSMRDGVLYSQPQTAFHRICDQVRPNKDGSMKRGQGANKETFPFHRLV